MVIYSKVRRYKEEEVNLNQLATLSEAVLKKKPFRWQLEAAASILCGKDAVVDVGTGSGKTLCFYLPLLLPGNERDISIVIGPLSALMIDQVS
jgi:ATP-dependent helicase YprA (DUF1998 family)